MGTIPHAPADAFSLGMKVGTVRQKLAASSELEALVLVMLIDRLVECGDIATLREITGLWDAATDGARLWRATSTTRTLR